MNQPDAQTAPNYVTCPCQHCSGNIEFDSNQLDGADNVTVPCPHCGLETKIFAPEQSVPPVVSDDIPQPPQSNEVEEEKSQPADNLQKTPPSQRNAEIQGSIGYFGLADWWLNNLLETERARIISLYDSRQAKTLTEGTVSRDPIALTWAGRMPMGYAHHSSGLGFQLGINCVDYLIKMVSFKLNPEKAGYGDRVMTTTKDFGLRAKIIQKIIGELDKPDAEVVDKHIAYSFLAMIFYSERKIDGFGVQRAIWACLKQIEICPQIKLLMRNPTRLTQDDLRRLSQEAANSGMSVWKYCLDQNIFRTNSIVRDSDIPPCDEGYRFLAEIFKNEKQYDRLVALCEKAIEQGWEGAFWKGTLTKNRVYLGDESPASEWLPTLPELKWDETLVNVPPTIPAPEIKPISDVPDCDLHFVNGVLQPLTPEQNSFYLKLVDSIQNKTYLSVGDQANYLVYYIRDRYKNLDRHELECLHDELASLAVPYAVVGRNITWKPKRWIYDCLLQLERYEQYFEVSKPADIFFSGEREASLRCSVRHYLGLPANCIDLLHLYEYHIKNPTKFTRQNPEKFEMVLGDVFVEYEQKYGLWLDRILKNADKTNYRQHVYICGHRFLPKFPKYSFETEGKSVIEQICEAVREAENRLRDMYGEKRVGEKWDEETKLFHTVKKMFPDLQVIHHGQPDWLGRMHLDIWIPELKIAIEYQGQQHFEEMKHFGGVESLEATKKRDALKRSACKREGVRLFEVTSPEDAQKAIREIKQAIQLAASKQNLLF